MFAMSYPAGFIDFCTAAGLRLTSLRRGILFVLWQEKGPLKAYEILTRLQKLGLVSQAPAVYRVLDYFVSLGMVHKIDAIQCYTLCQEPEHQHSEILLVCNVCHQVSESNDSELSQAILKLTANLSFQPGHDPVELKGFCKTCQPA